MRLRPSGDNREFEVEILSQDGGSIRARIDGRELRADLRRLADGSAILEAGGRRLRVYGAKRGHSIMVAVGPLQFEIVQAEGRQRAAHGLAAREVAAPMPGKVLKVMVGEGDKVEAGQPLIVMEAMKMETTLYAEAPAIVRRVRVAPGQTIDHGAVLIELSPSDSSAPESAARDS
jgi:biotin carboxyl carrier protein